MRYIDADKLLNEINGRITRCRMKAKAGYPDTTSSEATLKSFRSFITSLQQEQSEDFKEVEEAAEKYADSMGLKDFDRVRAISDFRAGVEWKERWFWADFELQLQKKMEEKEERLYKEYLKAEKLGKLPLTPEQKICKHQWDKTWVDHSDGFKKCPLCGRVETFWEPD